MVCCSILHRIHFFSFFFEWVWCCLCICFYPSTPSKSNLTTKILTPQTKTILHSTFLHWKNSYPWINRTSSRGSCERWCLWAGVVDGTVIAAVTTFLLRVCPATADTDFVLFTPCLHTARRGTSTGHIQMLLTKLLPLGARVFSIVNGMVTTTDLDVHCNVGCISRWCHWSVILWPH